MKTQRRHELQTNVLAHSLARWVEAAKPYSKAGTALLIVIVVALFAWAWMSTQSTRRAADGWNEYFDATSGRNPDPRELLRDISNRYTGTMVAQWARLSLADSQLDDGTNRLLQDRKLANDELTEASEKFQALLLEATHPTILQRATYGMARAHEALGDLERARKEYRSVASRWPGSPFAAAAEARANDLDELGTKNFYDWLAKYEPPPPLKNEPGKPGARPSFLEEPDAGGILDVPPIKDEGAGPALPTVIGPEGAEPKAKDKPKTEAAPETETPATGDSGSSPARADKKPDQPAPEPKPTPDGEPAPDQKPAPGSSEGPGRN
jgi:predicted negative regulator of RcsB-dependent stress response